MIKFFRKIRQRFLTESKFSKYLIYAIGEILLVVIGILIALYINNWNEHLNSKAQKKTIYAQVLQNLKEDTLNLNRIISEYEKKEVRFLEIINHTYPKNYFDSINKYNYTDCISCLIPITNFDPFYSQKEGYEMLKRYENEPNAINDKLLQNIIAFYNEQEVLNAVLDYVAEDVISNLSLIAKEDWFLDYYKGIYNIKSIDYILNNVLYKNQVAVTYTMQIKNYLSFLKIYKEDATKLMKEIEMLLNNE